MNRKLLLDALRKSGFTGKTYEEAFAFWKSVDGPELRVKGLTESISDAEFKKAWDTKAVALVEAEPEPEAEEDDEPEVVQKTATQRLMEKRAADAKALADVTGKAGTKMGFERKHGLARYEQKIKSGVKTVYSDVETAEAATALFRVSYAQCMGKTYSFEAEDRQILVDAGILTKTTSTLVNTDAGILVNPQFSNEILYNTEPYGLAVQIANVQPFSKTNDWSCKRKAGIMSMTHIGEGATLASGNNTWDDVHLIPKLAGCLTDITNQMLEDSAINVADQWANSIKEARDIRIDQDYFLGDGTATYGGHKGLRVGLVSGAYVNAAGNSWGAITRKNVSDLPGIVQNVNLERSGYVCSRQFYSQVMVPMQAALGGVTSNEGVNGGGAKMMNPNLAGSVNAYFNGWPVWFSQIGSTAGCLSQVSGSGQKDLFFGDYIGGSMVGLYSGLAVDVSKEFGFDKYKTYMRAVTRFAINICGDGRQPASTYGNIVCLQTT